MLAQETYKQWTAEFNPSSDYEGSGMKVQQFNLWEESKKERMVAIIRKNVPNRFFSIEHIDILDGDKQITDALRWKAGPEH